VQSFEGLEESVGEAESSEKKGKLRRGLIEVE